MRLKSKSILETGGIFELYAAKEKLESVLMKS